MIDTETVKILRETLFVKCLDTKPTKDWSICFTESKAETQAILDDSVKVQEILELSKNNNNYRYPNYNSPHFPWSPSEKRTMTFEVAEELEIKQNTPIISRVSGTQINMPIKDISLFVKENTSEVNIQLPLKQLVIEKIKNFWK